jgi:hypothetical protein
LNRQFCKEEVKMANKYMKKCLTFLAIKEMKMKMTQIPSHPRQNGYHQENASKDAGEMESLYTVGGNVNW